MNRLPVVLGWGEHRLPVVLGWGERRLPVVLGWGEHRLPVVLGWGEHRLPVVLGWGEHRLPVVLGWGEQTTCSVRVRWTQTTCSVGMRWTQTTCSVGLRWTQTSYSVGVRWTQTTYTIVLGQSEHRLPLVLQRGSPCLLVFTMVSVSPSLKDWEWAIHEGEVRKENSSLYFVLVCRVDSPCYSVLPFFFLPLTYSWLWGVGLWATSFAGATGSLCARATAILVPCILGLPEPCILDHGYY